MSTPTLLLAEKASGHLPCARVIPAPSAHFGHGLGPTSYSPEPQKALTSCTDQGGGQTPATASHRGQAAPAPTLADVENKMERKLKYC